MKNKKKHLPEYMKQIFVSVSLVVLIGMSLFLYRNYFFKEFRVVGNDMSPLINNGDTVRIALYKDETLKRGQLVAMQARDGSDDIWVRRVIALAGDTVECINGVVHVNGEPLNETYLDQWFIQQSIEDYGYFMNDFIPVYVPEGYFFYLGDNRRSADGKDARALGYAVNSCIVGTDLTLVQENKALR